MKIAVTSKSFSKNDFLVSELQKAFPKADLKLQKKPTGLNKAETIEFLSGCERAIIALEEIDQEILSKLPELKQISKFGVGLNNIDLEACKKHNVKVGWTGGVNKTSVAEMTLGFMLGLSRNLFLSAFHLQSGNWVKDGGFQLSEKTIGVIGVGHIGKEVIRLLEPFNCRILVNDIVEQKAYYAANNLIEVSKEEIFREADIITVHTPLSNETKSLFRIDTLKTCTKIPFIINTARGGIVEESDLIEAIEMKYISGAAIDVFVAEPLDIQEIYSNKKIVCTPHIGGNAKEAVQAMGISAIENLK